MVTLSSDISVIEPGVVRRERGLRVVYVPERHIGAMWERDTKINRRGVGARRRGSRSVATPGDLHSPDFAGALNLGVIRGTLMTCGQSSFTKVRVP